jgi:hypothetical protein
MFIFRVFFRVFPVAAFILYLLIPLFLPVFIFAAVLAHHPIQNDSGVFVGDRYHCPHTGALRPV